MVNERIRGHPPQPTNYHAEMAAANSRPDRAYHSLAQSPEATGEYGHNMTSSNASSQALVAPPARNVSLPHSAGLIAHPGVTQIPPIAVRQTQAQPYQPMLPTYPSHYGAPPPRTASAPVSQTEFYHGGAGNRSDGSYRLQAPNPTHMAAPPQTQPYRSRSTSNTEYRHNGIAADLPHFSPIEKAHAMSDVFDEPDSPLEDQQQMQSGPAVISARMKCKVFLKHGHQQWKSLGAAKLRLYVQRATNIKQLVVEADTREQTMLISTIVLTDGVERVAKTGVAVEISDMNGARTGIIYMIQLRDEDSAGGLFSSLISGSDRAKSMSISGRGA